MNKFALALAFAPAALYAAETADPRVRTFVDPVRVVATSESGAGGGFSGRCSVKDESYVLERVRGQVPNRGWGNGAGCRLENTGNSAWIVLDYGREIHGGLEFAVSFASTRVPRVRVRFGESVAETLSDALLGEKGACNDHAMRDFEISLPVMGTLEIGNTGFRFVRIDLVSPGKLTLESLRAVSLMRPMKRLGAFRCSDGRLNDIWETAVRTVHLCCQNMLWDGIKRDRLVWMGDTHPETCAILAVFGEADVLRDSLDHVAATTPPGRWVNGIDTYTTWFVRNMREYWFFTGDESFLKAREKALRTAIGNLVSPDAVKGRGGMPGFLDWPTHDDPESEKTGAAALRALGLDDAAEMADVLGDAALAAKCRSEASALRSAGAPACHAKSAAAIVALAGMRSPKLVFSETLGRNGHEGVSTFYGYYMLEAMSAAGEDARALDTARDYWGGMLDMGATSFWEDFSLSWTNNAFRIDEMPVAGKKDMHGDFGAYCYRGFRHSLCHGWSAGPAAWCINHVLGIRPLDAGCKTVEVRPFLGDLDWAEGAMALPGGRSVKVKAVKRADGGIDFTVDAPDGVEVRK